MLHAVLGCSEQGIYHQAICGDLNTMAHRLPRLSRHFCTDKMRFLSIGQEEASFWDNRVLKTLDPKFLRDSPGATETVYM